MLGELVKLMEADATVRRVVAAIYRNPDALKARMHFYYAQQHAADDKKDEQRKSLDQALKHDPSDGDVLIDLYRLTRSDPEEHKKTQAKVKTAVDIMLKKIAAEPDSATWYNQYAWLVANTEGDKEKALKMSLKSVELRPDSGGLLDTLAHCYFAVKKYDEAVATQERAVTLEPSSRTIKKKLDMFRAARDAAKGAKKAA
jgi:tetratricopeptide (TPR) repeat protein